ncbi:hypothetical protein [Marinococcus halotolerans]|uniref:hypothetical protein n=1 Tax=Marinococcus halotolerans TaxID=301092 RepID=UPI0003B584D3|nr:hypothetical protein [Marinococcus halotolerans]
MRNTKREQQLLQLFETNPDEWEPSVPGDLRAFYNLFVSGRVTFEEIKRVSQGVVYVRPRCVQRKEEGVFSKREDRQ